MSSSQCNSGGTACLVPPPLSRVPHCVILQTEWFATDHYPSRLGFNIRRQASKLVIIIHTHIGVQWPALSRPRHTGTWNATIPPALHPVRTVVLWPGLAPCPCRQFSVTKEEGRSNPCEEFRLINQTIDRGQLGASGNNLFTILMPFKIQINRIFSFLDSKSNLYLLT